MAVITTSPLVKTYTLEEFWQLPERSDGTKLELIAGVLYMSPPPDYKHDDVVDRVYDQLSAHRRAKRIAGRFHVPRAAIWTASGTYLEPDLFYVSAETRAMSDPNRRTTADLVIEVISPASAIYDRNTKADTYAALGIRELWLIDEKSQRVEVRINVDGCFDPGIVFGLGQNVVPTVFPDLRLAVDDLFSG